MNRRFIRVISFCVLFSILFSFINSIMEIPNLRWRVFYKLPKNSIDILFMGNSHSFYSFEPLIIDKLLNTNSYTVGVGGENIVLSYYELREILKYQHPKVVVLETFTLEMTELTTGEPYYFEFIDAGMWDGNKLAVANRYLTLDTMYTVFPALRTRISWEDLSPYRQVYKNKMSDVISWNSNEFGQRGATPNFRVINDEEYRTILKQPPSEHRIPPVVNRIYLEKFYDLCRKNNIQLVLTSTPMAGEPIRNERYVPYDVTHFAETQDIPYITYNPSLFNHLHFVNVDHVNEFGAMIVSITMAAHLAEILEIDVDQERLNDFQALVFNDFSLTSEKREVAISLIQAQPEIPLEYQWSIRNRSTETDVYLGEWTSDSSLCFQLPENGSYEITVKIRKSSEGFVLTGLFSIGKWGPLGVEKKTIEIHK